MPHQMSSYVFLPIPDAELLQMLWDVRFPLQLVKDNQEHMYIVPNLYSVASWLRERHGMHPFASSLNVSHSKWSKSVDIKSKGLFTFMAEEFTSHDDALLSAIKWCVNRIKDKNGN